MQLEWDEYRATEPHESDRWASSDRGWCRWVDHPDAEWHAQGWGSPMVANYLDYAGTGEPGQDGKLVHVCVYVCEVDSLTGRQSTRHLGFGWAATVADARTMAEGILRTRLELARAS